MHEKQTALHLACENGHVAMVSFLIESGANINTKGLGGSTPLHGAAILGQIDVVRKLLSEGAERTLLSRMGHQNYNRQKLS